MKTIERSVNPGAGRYVYDMNHCSIAEGWAQVDTSQDAGYFGTWINPARRETVCYCEGDVTRCHFDTDAELVEEVARIKTWSQDNGHSFFGIDPGFDDALKSQLITAGLESYLH